MFAVEERVAPRRSLIWSSGPTRARPGIVKGVRGRLRRVMFRDSVKEGGKDVLRATWAKRLSAVTRM